MKKFTIAGEVCQNLADDFYSSDHMNATRPVEPSPEFKALYEEIRGGFGREQFLQNLFSGVEG